MTEKTTDLVKKLEQHAIRKRQLIGIHSAHLALADSLLALHGTMKENCSAEALEVIALAEVMAAACQLME